MAKSALRISPTAWKHRPKKIHRNIRLSSRSTLPGFKSPYFDQDDGRLGQSVKGCLFHIRKTKSATLKRKRLEFNSPTVVKFYPYISIQKTKIFTICPWWRSTARHFFLQATMGDLPLVQVAQAFDDAAHIEHHVLEKCAFF